MPPLRLICNECGHRLWLEEGQAVLCPECHGELRQMGLFEGFVDRWFAPPDMLASDLHRRHLQLVEQLWTAGGRGREFYEIINPEKVSYSSFVKRVNALVCRGLEEGWIEARIPSGNSASAPAPWRSASHPTNSVLWPYSSGARPPAPTRLKSARLTSPDHG